MLKDFMKTPGEEFHIYYTFQVAVLRTFIQT